MSNRIVTEQIGQLALPSAQGMSAAMPYQAATGGITGKDILRILRKRMWMIIIISLLFVAIAAVSTFFWLRISPLYTAESYLQVNIRTNPMKDEVVNTLSKDVMDRLVNTQILVINQDILYSDVVRDSSPQYSITGTEWHRARSDTAVRDLKDEVKVSAAFSAIRISMTGRNPEDLARIVNSVAHHATLRSRDRAEAITEGMIRLLVNERAAISNSLANVHTRMAAARPADIPMIQEQRNSLSIKIQELTRRVEELRIQEAAARAAVDRLRDADAEDLRGSPEVLYALDINPEIRTLKTYKVHLENEYANFRRMFADQHRLVLAAETKLESCANQLDDLQNAVIEKTIASIKTAREAAHTSIIEQSNTLRESLLESEARLKDNETNIERLRQLGDEERMLNDSLKRVDEKLREVRLQKEADVPLTIAVPAAIPAEPSMPKWSIMLPVGLFLGLLVGVGLAFLLELMDNSVKSATDLTRRLHLPVLGMLPHADDLEDDIRDVRTAFMTNPNSLLGESFRQIRTCLRFSGPADRRRTLLVSSPMPEDGRTTVAVNLGAAFARDGMNVLILDANFRQPAVRKLFPQATDTGLSNVLSGQAKWQDAVCQVEPNLTVMTSGPLPPNPAELLGSPAMRQLIAELGKHFDQVILDGAPALLVSDSPILATAVDATILVVRAGENTHDIVQRAWDTFRHVDANVLGAVLNGVRTVADGHLRRSYNAFYEYHEQLPGK
ncbi:MAG: polysaccharide biosynthesis tyrosine autokinase [Phycisphaerae bacterium]|nr:polysaccharide biosynthesis tyrosine autokinase [Phycisphaerae bacterium]